MPDNKLTDKKYKRTYNPCDDCLHSFTKNNQESGVCEICEFKQSLDQITRLQTEKQDLEIELRAMRGAANSYKAEIERLRYNLEAVLDERADHSEAYKEFAERLKEKSKQGKGYLGNVYHSVDVAEIDNLLKEMEGDNQ